MIARVNSAAENEYGQFGVFVKFAGNNLGLLHKNQMKRVFWNIKSEMK